MRELYEKVYMHSWGAIFMKRKIICFLLFLFVSSTIFSLEKNISGKELEALNKVYIIYCKDFEFKKENIDRINFSILEKNGNYYITISERGVLGGVGNFVLNCKTLEIIKKTYEE